MPSYFSRKLFKFLIELAHNNDRAWFQANKERYEKEVRDPLLAFITDFQKPLSRVSASFVADPRRAGAHCFAFHRDVRFAKDKSPYKTHAAAHFRHARGKDVHAPGFYLHLEPGSVFLGSGLWRPEPETLLAIRRAISERPKDWTMRSPENRSTPRQARRRAPRASAEGVRGGSSADRAPSPERLRRDHPASRRKKPVRTGS